MPSGLIGAMGLRGPTGPSPKPKDPGPIGQPGNTGPRGPPGTNQYLQNVWKYDDLRKQYAEDLGDDVIDRVMTDRTTPFDDHCVRRCVLAYRVSDRRRLKCHSLTESIDRAEMYIREDYV